ncbi:MAG: TlpA family protein disulfide reductase [Spirochaetales bacterium]
MSAATLTLQIGPANVPLALLLIVGGVVAAQVASRLLWRRQKESAIAVNDLATTAVLIGFFLWKLTPLVTRFSLIAEAPLRLLYYPGGTPGVVIGVIAGLIYATIAIKRSELELSLTRLTLQVALLLGVPLVLVTIALVIPIEAPVSRGEAPLVYLDREGVDPALPSSLREVETPLVVVYWATWCGPCTAQMPEVERAWNELKPRALFLAVNLVYTEPSASAVADYVADNSLSFPIVLDSNGELGEIHEVSSTPTTLIFDSSGSLVARRTGPVNADWIVGRVLPHLE